MLLSMLKHQHWSEIDAAVEVNLIWWVAEPQRQVRDMDPAVRALVRLMQRRAFELTAGWDDVDEREPEPPALDRLGEIRIPNLVLSGTGTSRSPSIPRPSRLVAKITSRSHDRCSTSANTAAASSRCSRAVQCYADDKTCGDRYGGWR